MGTFDSGADPRRNKKQSLDGILNRGVVPAATVGTGQVPVRGLGLSNLHIGGSGFVYDPVTHGYAVHAQSNPVLAGQWTRVGNIFAPLQCPLSLDEDSVVTVWGKFSWKNGGTDPAGHTRALIGFWDGDFSSPLPTLWAENETYQWLPADNHFYPYDTFGRYVIPAGDWAVGILHQYNADGDHAQQSVRGSSLMTLVSAYDPASDPESGTPPVLT